MVLCFVCWVDCVEIGILCFVGVDEGYGVIDLWELVDFVVVDVGIVDWGVFGIFDVWG